MKANWPPCPPCPAPAVWNTSSTAPPVWGTVSVSQLPQRLLPPPRPGCQLQVLLRL